LNRVQHSPIGKRIVSGTFWSVVGNGFGKLFTFIAMVLVARILGKEAFGEFGLVRSTATMFVAVSSFGMGLTATKYIAELLHTDKERTGRIIGLTYVFTFFTSLLVAIMFYLISPWICETQLNKPELTNVMQLGAVLLFLMTFMGTQVAVMTGFQDFRGLAFAALIGGLTMLPIYVVGTYYWGICGSVIGAILVTSLNIFINICFIYQNINKYQICYDFINIHKEWHVLGQSNIPLVLANIIYSSMFWICQLMLAGQTNGSAELGIYYVAMNFQMIMFFLPQQLQPVFFPILSELNGKNYHSQYWKVVRKYWFSTISITLITIIPFILMPELFMGIFGIEFTDNWLVLIITGSGVLINSVTSISCHILISRGQNWLHCFLTLISMLSFYIITYILLQYKLGASSLILGYAFNQILYMAMTIICTSKTIKNSLILC
jgi:O-antigen/teichoic acid export membrane protein